MSDQAHDYAERKIAEFQAEVWGTYQQAQADAQEALAKFLKRFEKEDEKRRKLVEKGEMAKAEYKSWRSGQILRSKQLSSTLDQVSQAMTEANQVAMAALAGKLPEVYAENANYSAVWMCKETGLAVSFDLVDPDTVQHMLTAGEALFMAPGVNVAKDKLWNRKLMASQLTQGVLLGESIPKMARRVQRVTGSNYAAAVRTARTAVTGAENAGRVHSYKRAKDMGIKLQKEWLATLDGRTRHSHRQLDGQKIPNEDGAKFDNGCRYPGDPQGRYDEICNCRCTLVAAIEGVDTSDAERWSRLPEGMTYEEWKAGYPERPQHDSSGRTMGEFFAQPSVKAQLEKRGMTEAQARKALSEHLKAQGASGSTFRAMQRAEQQRAWSNALKSLEMGPLGGFVPVGMSETRAQRDLAVDMARILAKSKDADIKALYRKYGQQFVIASDAAGSDCLFDERLGGVKLDVARARRGDDVHLPHEVAFHEFGHMIDWLSSGRKGFTSSRSRIVEAIDRDWESYITKAAKRGAAKRFEELAEKDPRQAIREVREKAKEIGSRSVVDLCRKARSANRENGTEWRALYLRLIGDDEFSKVVDSLLSSTAEWDVKYNRREINSQVIADLRKRVNDRTKYSLYDASDVIEGATGVPFPLGAGHGGDYFTSEFYGGGNRAAEFFAEACSAKVMNGESLATLVEMFPTAMSEFERVVKEILRW